MSQPSKKYKETISGRIQELMDLKNLTPYRICKDIGMPEISFHRSIKTNDKWKLQHLVRIAEYFQVSLDYLASGNTNNINEKLRVENYKYREELLLLRERITTYEVAAKSIIEESKVHSKSKNKSLK
jgi:hypothetical protein